MRGPAAARRTGPADGAPPRSSSRCPPPSARRPAAATVLFLALAAGPAAPAPSPDDAWGTLANLRSALEAASPLATTFEQQYLPAGFSTGDREQGELALDLPACVRWDYAEPFAKSFLICGATVWAWNPGESGGRRAFVAAEEAPGLDLLRLDLVELQGRYRAELEPAGPETPDGGAVVRLAPLDPGAASGRIVEARLELSPAGDRLTAVAWTDAEGNRTRFTLGTFAPLTGRETFSPPDGIEWLEP